MNDCNHSVLPERKLTETNSTVAERAKANPTRLTTHTRYRNPNAAYAIIYGETIKVIHRKADKESGNSNVLKEGEYLMKESLNA